MRREWGENALRELRAKLGRSTWSIKARARVLRLPGVPQGWVSLEHASKVCGMERETLALLLARHEVKVRRWYAAAAKGLGAHRYVLLDEAREAVEREVREYETLNAAATRKKINRQRLARWIALAGVQVLRCASFGYVRSADVDRVCRARGWRPGSITINAAACLLGVKREVLARALGAPQGLGGTCCTTLARARSALERRKGPSVRRVAGPRTEGLERNFRLLRTGTEGP